MLKVGGVVSSLFQLVFGVPSKLALDAIDKGLGVPEVLSEKVFKLRPHDWSGAFVVVLVLGPSEADVATKEYGSKEGTIYPCGAWDFKIILTLLTKVVAIHMRFSEIGLLGPSLEWALLWLCQGLGLGRLHEHIHESDEEILSGGRNKRWSGSLRRGKSLGKSLITPGVGFFCWALGTGKLI